MNEKESFFLLCNLEGVYLTQIKALLSVFKTPENVFKATDKEIIKSRVLDEKDTEIFLKSRKNDLILKDLEKAEKDGINFVYQSHPDFPVQLKNIPEAPLCLYVKGSLPDPMKYSVGMVGARKCSGYGKEMALKFSKNLASRDIQIISGMALGIDTFSSKGALEVGGKTFVVLGTGVDVIYPLDNIELYYQIILSGGGIISEFPLGTYGNPINFPFRNRIISGLSDKLLIIEARKRSGTLTTAGHALRQDVDIYAVPGRITDKTSEGCNRLISDGCGVMLDLEDFLNDLYLKEPRGKRLLSNGNLGNNLNQKSTKMEYERKFQNNADLELSPFKEADDIGLSDESRRILNKISFTPITIEKLIKETESDVNEVMIALSELELMGLIEEVSKDLYVRVN